MYLVQVQEEFQYFIITKNGEVSVKVLTVRQEYKEDVDVLFLVNRL